MDELRQRIAELLARVRDIQVRLDLPAQERELARVKQEAEEPSLWDDQANAQRVMKAVARLESLIETWRSLESGSQDLQTLLELAAEADEAERAPVLAEIETELALLQAQFGALEMSLTLGGPYDVRNALLSVHAGAGGTEAQDWAEMLLRMYLRWAEQHGFTSEILAISSGEEAGIKSADLKISGDYAYGMLRSERGVHRLVRISPFDSSHSRHTSFALVEVMPEAEAHDNTIEVKPDDLRVDTFRASGHGGQNVQKNDTAVRLTHLPTGIVVTCQNERSQGQNRESAMLVLKSRLLELEIEQREVEKQRLKGAHIEAGWGNQIRSYVLHPYKMVKDLRTGTETSDTARVLDGGIDEFVTAYLREQVGTEAAG
ncbi:MAG: peptide chain release factor 2 [Dehalococcoidia bacterium]|nr:MAG: peptide chain release factor 2 [Dehalococcoidia bacterium]